MAAGTLSKGFDEEKESSLRSMADHRRLCHATASPELDHFYQTGKMSRTTNVAAWHHKYLDLGATHYYRMTRVSAQYLNPTSRQGLVTYIAHFFVKLQFLIDLMHHVCTLNARKLLIFCDWLLT